MGGWGVSMTLVKEVSVSVCVGGGLAQFHFFIINIQK